jgi:universal stress protein E
VGYQHILLVIDPAQSEVWAIERAVALASRSGAALRILVVADPPSVSDWAVMISAQDECERYRHELQAWLRKQLNALGDKVNNLSVTTEVILNDDPAATIRDKSELWRPDLLMKTLRHESPLKRAFMWPLDWYLIRECAMPVYLLGAGAQAMPENIFAAVDLLDEQDPSVQDDEVLVEAVKLTWQWGAQLHIVHALDMGETSVTERDYRQSWEKLIDKRRSFCQERLAGLGDRYDVAPQRRHLLEGDALPALAKLMASAASDVIVLGRTRHERLDVWLGNTTERFVTKSPLCAVLAVGQPSGSRSPKGLPGLRRRIDTLIQAIFLD